MPRTLRKYIQTIQNIGKNKTGKVVKNVKPINVVNTKTKYNDKPKWKIQRKTKKYKVINLIKNIRNEKKQKEFTAKPQEPLKLNCSPEVKGNVASSKTCYTPDILLKIRDEYNNKHSEFDKIRSDNPNVVWKELKMRLTHCKKEDCWLQEISDTNLRNQIDTYIFAPDSPPEWKNNPNEWLSNIDIDSVMKQYEKKYKYYRFIKSSPIDFDDKPKTMGGNSCVTQELCEFSLKKMMDMGIKKIGMVFNLDKHNQSGSHWVSMFLDIPSKFIFYFDSNGVDIPEEIKELKDRIVSQGKELNKPIHLDFYETDKTHQQSNTECGMYSLFFHITMLTNNIMGQRINMDDKIKLFKNNVIPDKFVENYRKVYFNSNT